MQYAQVDFTSLALRSERRSELKALNSLVCLTREESPKAFNSTLCLIGLVFVTLGLQLANTSICFEFVTSSPFEGANSSFGLVDLTKFSTRLYA